MFVNEFCQLREMIMGEEADEIENQMVHNPNPGSVLMPSSIGGGTEK